MNCHSTLLENDETIKEGKPTGRHRDNKKNEYKTEELGRGKKYESSVESLT